VPRAVVAAVAAQLALLATAAPALAGDPIMPLGDVRAGMECTGYSVVKGTAISSFAVTIEAVVAGDKLAQSPRLLIRASGPAVDATGLGPGFSGSPIYCPGDDGVQRVAGAVSESVGEYGGKVALATPIEAILGEPVDPPAGARSAPALLRSARPIATPLTIGGLSTPIASRVRRAAAKAGRTVYAIPAAPRADGPAPPPQPGSSIAAGLASGDVTASAVGTVAYVDGDRVWAFGHPLDSVGRRDLFLQDAFVYTVVNNPLGTQDAQSYKLAAPGADIGMLTSDGINAVAGRLGVLPDRFPLQIVAQDLDTGRVQSTDVQLADETVIGLPTGASALSAVGPIAVAQAAYGILGGAPLRQSGTMCVRFTVREAKRPLRFCNSYVGGGGGSQELAGAPLVADFGEAVSLIDAYDVATLHLTRVEVGVKLRRGLRQAFLVSASGPSVVRRGSTVRLRVTLRRVRGARFTRTIKVRVPRDQATGDFDLTLTGTPADDSGDASGDSTAIDLGSLLDTTGGGAETEPPTSLRELASAIADLHRYDGVTASFQELGAAGGDGSGDGPAERPVFHDEALRVSGSAVVPITVRGAKGRSHRR
jgi:hypothetical protein